MDSGRELPTRPTALDGIKVVELGSLIAGPMAGRVLADFGATVVKVENPTAPDPMRSWGRAAKNGRSLWWAVQSRNKYLAALDLKSEEGRLELLELLADADVLIENFRPGTLERLGLAPETLWQRNPGLIVARVSGYGQTGPHAHKPGYAAVAEAVGGLRHLNGFPDLPPPRTGISLGDSLAALYAVQGILTALYWRDARGGRGQLVDVALVDSSFSLLEGAVPEYAEAGIVPGPSGTRLDGIAPSNIYRSQDGKWIAIAANQDTVFRRLARAIGKPELADDPRFADHESRGVGAHQDALDDLIGSWVAQHDASYVETTMDAHGVPAGRVNTIEDIFDDPHFHERELLVEVGSDDEKITHPGVVPRLTLTPGTIRWSGSSGVGEDPARFRVPTVGERR